MLTSRFVRRSRTSTFKKLFRHASAGQDLVSRSFATATEDEKDERNIQGRSYHLRFQPPHACPSLWPWHCFDNQRLAISARVSFDSLAPEVSVSFDSLARSSSWSARPFMDCPLLLDVGPQLNDLYKLPPPRTDYAMSPRPMRKVIYASTVRSMGGSTSTPFQQAMHRVVHQACFSTQPDPPKEGSSGSSPLSSSSSASFSTSTTQLLEKSYAEKARETIVSASKAILSFLFKLPGVMLFYLTHPKELKAKLQELKEAAKKEAHHYWMGTKVGRCASVVAPCAFVLYLTHAY